MKKTQKIKIEIPGMYEIANTFLPNDGCLISHKFFGVGFETLDPTRFPVCHTAGPGEAPGPSCENSELAWFRTALQRQLQNEEEPQTYNV